MAESAKDVYVRMVAKFATAEKERLLVIDENTNKILFVHVPKMQEAKRKAEETPPAVLAGYGHAAQTYWLARDGASRELATALDEFEVIAAGWFTKARKKPFTDAMGRLRNGFQKLTDADKAVTKAFNALMDQFPDRAQKLAAGADTLAKEGKTDIDAALVVLGTLLSALSPDAKVSDKKPKIKVPLRDWVTSPSRISFSKLKLASRSANSARCSSGTLGCRGAKGSTGSSSGHGGANAPGWAVREDFTTTMASLGQGFDKLTEADDKVIAAFDAIEAQLAQAAKNPDFSEAAKLSRESDAAANEGATQIEAQLVALWHLVGTCP